MALSEEDRKEIIAVIREETHGNCACGLSFESQQEVGHFFGRLKDLGKGNLNEGIEIFSRAIGMVSKFRRGGERIGGAIAVYTCITIVGGIIALIVAGAVVMVKKAAGS